MRILKDLFWFIKLMIYKFKSFFEVKFDIIYCNIFVGIVRVDYVNGILYLFDRLE